MKRAAVGVVLCLLLCPIPTIPGPQRATSASSRWWRDPAIQHGIKLTTGQAHQLDRIFDRDRPARIALHEKIRRLDGELLRVIADEDEATVIRFIAAVEELRRMQNTRRALMLLE